MLNIQRNAPKKICIKRHAPIVDDEPEEKIENNMDGALDKPLYRCYCCNKIASEGKTIRVINAKKRLAICSNCDSSKDNQLEVKHIERNSPIPREKPENAICTVCKGELIDPKKLQRKLDRLTDGSAIKETDRARIETSIKNEGWRDIGKGKYAHTRCLNRKIRRK